MGSHKIAGFALLAFVAVSPLTLEAQAPLPMAGKAQTDDELRGEARFVKACFLCHNPTGQTKELGIAVTDLVGLFKRPGITEEYVRQRIMEGVPPRRMPAYKHTYTPTELNEIIAYLKIR